MASFLPPLPSIFFSLSSPLSPVADPDLRYGGGGGGHPDPEITGAPGLKNFFFRPFVPQFGLKLRGEGSATAPGTSLHFFISVFLPSSLFPFPSMSSFRRAAVFPRSVYLSHSFIPPSSRHFCLYSSFPRRSSPLSFPPLFVFVFFFIISLLLFYLPLSIHFSSVTFSLSTLPPPFPSHY